MPMIELHRQPDAALKVCVHKEWWSYIAKNRVCAATGRPRCGNPTRFFETNVLSIPVQMKPEPIAAADARPPYIRSRRRLGQALMAGDGFPTSASLPVSPARILRQRCTRQQLSWRWNVGLFGSIFCSDEDYFRQTPNNCVIASSTQISPPKDDKYPCKLPEPYPFH